MITTEGGVDRPAWQALLGLIPGLLVLGFVANLTMLVSPIFMMQLLDRVVPSGNMATLGLLMMIAILFIAMGAVIEAKRMRIVKEAGLWTEARSGHEGLANPSFVQKLRMSGSASAVLAVLDTPWLTVFATALFILSPYFLILVGVAIVIGPLSQCMKSPTNRVDPAADAEASIRRLNAVQGPYGGVMHIAANLRGHLADRAQAVRGALRHEGRTQEGRMRKTQLVRQVMQLSLLALGGALVSSGALSAGGMIAASLIGVKTLTLAEGSFQNFAEVKALWGAISGINSNPKEGSENNNEVPTNGALQVVALTEPQRRSGGFRLHKVEFDLAAGRTLAILGPSGSGKSSLVGFLAGIETPTLGQIRLGGVDLRRMSQAAHQSSVGVMPQMSRFDQGRIHEIISCFALDADQDQVEDAAIAAGIHNVVLGLPQGYATDLAEEGYLLSVGQMQKLALARAIYHKPKLLLLDEPNALQDSLGEQQISDALARLKAEGVTIVMVVHRIGIMWLADDVLVLDRGRVADFGPRAEVLARRSHPNRVIDLSLTPGGVQEVEDWVTHQFQREGDAALRQRAIIIATEMFNYVRLTGEVGVQRVARMSFAFEEGDRFRITIREEKNAVLNAQMSALRDRLSDRPGLAKTESEVDMALTILSHSADAWDVALDGDAAALAAVIRTVGMPEQMRVN